MGYRWHQPAFQRELLEDLPRTEDFVEAMEGVMGVVRGATDVAQALDALLTEPDPLSAILALANNQLQQFLISLQESDVYMLPLKPHSWRALLRPYTMNHALTELGASVTDYLDGSRPQFGPNDAWASFTLAVGANNWMDFEEALKVFGTLFSAEEGDQWMRLFTMKFNFDKAKRNPMERRYRNTQGVAPDWTRTNWLEQIPILGPLVALLTQILNELLPYSRGLATGIAELVKLLEKRIEKIAAAMTQVNKVLELITAWQQLLPRLHYLAAASPRGGVTDYVSAVTNALHRPEFKLMAGVTFVAFGPNALEYIKTVGTFIGLKMDEVEASYNRVQAGFEEQPA